VLLVTLRPSGFAPKLITRPQGRFLLTVDNRSGLNEMFLRLDSLTFNRVIDRHVSRERLNLRQVVDLTPGQYLLTEANHPNWICAIAITPR
jgi:hypothetical protein